MPAPTAVSPPTQPPYVPLPSLPPMVLDETNNGVEFVQRMTRAKALMVRNISLPTDYITNCVRAKLK